MKLQVNPIDVLMQSRVSILQKHLRDVSDLLENALFSLNHMKKICNKIYKQVKSKRYSSIKVANYIATLEGVVNSCEKNGVHLLTGSFKRNSFGKEFWYRNGFNLDYRNRIYFPDMRLETLGLKGIKKISVSIIKAALVRINKAIADVSTNKEVVKKIAHYNSKGINRKDFGMFLENKTGYFQMQFLYTAEHAVLCIKKIIKHLESIHKQVVSSQKDKLLYQVEVSGLIDELDRVVSHASYNQIQIFTGHFAKGGKYTRELYFIAPDDTDKRKRMFFKTMHSIALSLKEKNYAPINISKASAKDKLHKAYLQVSDEENKIKEYIQYFNKQRI